ncbi:class I SAM-dependent methyltransferase [Actinomadura madurae]|uniref:class I SAM-dependent methyltransferase n=1 Tax=Actinomadura madurae TaxID=1993 RepID=UPI0020D22E3F|nr:methyltransferase domain-containing protein [Actinomadura madurae]MCP9970743.1 methyltransferase domain-containing protein [Actinomadura madurae]MCQ0005224.1 methyltransferase domain-containing protein [Actinomadura madurae]
MTVTHEEKVVREFSKQAAGFADPELNVAFTRHLDRLVRFMDPEIDQDDVVLEVAAGTGLVSRAIARRVRHVTALDLTPAMLAEGKRAADHTGLMNVTFAHGDATALPYLDRSFTLVVTRFSLHQVADPEAVVKEMVRVSRPGAALIIADLVRPGGPGGRPRPRRAAPRPLPRGDAHRGADHRTPHGGGGRGEARGILRRLAPARPVAGVLPHPGRRRGADQGRAAGRAGGRAATGMRPSSVDGVLHFTHSYLFQQAIAG